MNGCACDVRACVRARTSTCVSRTCWAQVFDSAGAGLFVLKVPPVQAETPTSLSEAPKTPSDSWNGSSKSRLFRFAYEDDERGGHWGARRPQYFTGTVREWHMIALACC